MTPYTNQENMRSLLSEYFEKQREAEIRGTVVFYATRKKSLSTTPQAISPTEEGRRIQISVRN